MSILLGIGFALFVSYIIYNWYESLQFKQKLSWVPSIPGWPILGNILEFRDPIRFIDDIKRLIPKKEKTIFLEITNKRSIFTSDYDLIEFLLSSQTLITKSSNYETFADWLGTGILTSNGAKWKSRRRILTPAFHFSILGEFVDVFESNSNILIKKLSENSEKGSFDIYQYFTLYALDVICETAMGIQVNAQHEENSEYVRNVKFMCQLLLDRLTSLLKFNDFLYSFTSDYQREKKAIEQLHSFTNNVIDERRSKIAKNDKKEVDELGRKKKLAFLDILLKCTENGKPLSNEGIREEVDTFMFAGHDTTASAMTFCTYLLSKHPEVQDRILEEQQQIFESDILRPSTYKDLQEMKYLECVIKESLRIYPSVPIIGRYITEDVNYKGNIIPKGTDIFAVFIVLFHDPDRFPNPEKFDPSRFEEINGKRPYQFTPFSAGPRNCIGQKFAMLEIKSTISTLVRNFKILPDPEHKILVVLDTVLKSKSGVRVKLVKRKW